MNTHRIHLSDDELAEICAALRARMSMRFDARRARTIKLLARLEDGGPGNPNLRFGPPCVHGIPMTGACEKCGAQVNRIVRDAADEVARENPHLARSRQP